MTFKYEKNVIIFTNLRGKARKTRLQDDNTAGIGYTTRNTQNGLL